MVGMHRGSGGEAASFLSCCFSGATLEIRSQACRRKARANHVAGLDRAPRVESIAGRVEDAVDPLGCCLLALFLGRCFFAFL
jgi:hypothetical protein